MWTVWALFKRLETLRRSLKGPQSTEQVSYPPKELFCTTILENAPVVGARPCQVNHETFSSTDVIWRRLQNPPQSRHNPPKGEVLDDIKEYATRPFCIRRTAYRHSIIGCADHLSYKNFRHVSWGTNDLLAFLYYNLCIRCSCSIRII